MACPRRRLRFHTLGDILEEVSKLSAAPYDKAGQWDLAQVCGHLALAFELSIEGFDRPAPSGIRRQMGRIALRIVLFIGRIPAGRPLPEQSRPPANVDLAIAIDCLKLAIQRFSGASEPLAAHPLFGPLSKPDWAGFHLLHSAHHLGFLTPLGFPSEKRV